MRDWCAILIDAALRDLRVVDVAREQETASSTVTVQTKAHGILLRGQNPDCSSPTYTRPRGNRHLRPKDWRAELTFAKINREDLNTFCRRTGVATTTALAKAEELGH